ncbi:MAG: PAS domain S-box protein, partial [Chloroflexi bacterium]|nr:PAS domain S-box protein [Chloroflexota bacterium]
MIVPESAHEQDGNRPSSGQMDRERVLGRLLACAGSAIVAMDADGVFTYVNRRACEIAGYTEADLIGRNFADLIEPELLPQVSADFARALGNQAAVQDVRISIRRRDGEQRWL